jgi:hypothetical protein
VKSIVGILENWRKNKPPAKGCFVEGSVKQFVINVGDYSDEETEFQTEFRDDTFSDSDSSGLGEPL